MGEPRELDGREGWQAQPDADYAAEFVTISRSALAGAMFQSAGAGAAAIMSKDGPAGEVVMPTEEISEAVCGMLGELGVDVARIPGYRGAFPPEEQPE